MKPMTFIKALMMCALLSPLGIQASENCQQIQNDMILFCDGLADQCDFIESCLVRRDTCVERTPSNQQECTELNECAEKVARYLPERERCEYKWAVTETSKFCRVDGHFLFFEAGCPGNIGGLLSAFAYGLNATVDADFKCKAQKSMYAKKMESCLDYRKKYKESCLKGKDDHKILAQSAPNKCDVYEKFDQYPHGTFYLDVPGKGTNSKNRSRHKALQLQKDRPGAESLDVIRR